LGRSIEKNINSFVSKIRNRIAKICATQIPTATLPKKLAIIYLMQKKSRSASAPPKYEQLFALSKMYDFKKSNATFPPSILRKIFSIS
jgi:hypothetical protein